MGKFIYVISVSEDGDVDIRGMSKELFIMGMNTKPDDDFNGSDPIDATKMRIDVNESDPMYWGDKSILAIEGEIVVPVPIRTVDKWDASTIDLRTPRKPDMLEQLADFDFSKAGDDG